MEIKRLILMMFGWRLVECTIFRNVQQFRPFIEEVLSVCLFLPFVILHEVRLH